jgi:hypothetical protein
MDEPWEKESPVADEVGGKSDGLVSPADPLLLHQHRHPLPLELHAAELLAEPEEPLVAAARIRQEHTVELLRPPLLRPLGRWQERRRLLTLTARGRGQPRPLARGGSLDARRQTKPQAGPVEPRGRGRGRRRRRGRLGRVSVRAGPLVVADLDAEPNLRVALLLEKDPVPRREHGPRRRRRAPGAATCRAQAQPAAGARRRRAGLLGGGHEPGHHQHREPRRVGRPECGGAQQVGLGAACLGVAAVESPDLVDVLAIGDEAGAAVAEREGAAALVGLGGHGGHGEERHAGDGLPHRAAARRRRNPGQRDLAAAGRVPAEAETGPHGEVVRVGELGGRRERQAQGPVAVVDGGRRYGAREGVVEARVVLLGSLERRHGDGGDGAHGRMERTESPCGALYSVRGHHWLK